jgi:hypothetical protein
MPAALPTGPYRILRLDDGTEVPYYVVPFDKQGRCEGPETRKHLVDAVSKGTYTDLFLFSHGWNNDWTVATNRYEHFINGFMAMRRKHALKVRQPYRPLLVGIFWPSTALVFGEDEEGPLIAAGDPSATDRAIAEERQAVREVAAQLPERHVERFYELTQKDGLTDEEARELATIVQPLYANSDTEVRNERQPTAAEIVDVWRAASPDTDDLTAVGTVGGGDAAVARTAGFTDVLKKLDPRQIVRVLTVRQMKDRAGTVGANGVGPLLRDLLAAQNDKPADARARVNLIGHSYGGKVVLSAISVGGDLPRRVHSVLLLQPAVSHLCFAEKVPGTDRSGGYRPALDRVERPIFSTFSDHDFPLTKVFHVALRRSEDLGEARIAAAGEPPSVYAALGGFGPRRSGEKLIDVMDVNQPYLIDEGTRIYGIRSTRTIMGHGDISNESTWWALYSLAAA